MGVKANGKVSAIDLVVVNDGGMTGAGSGIHSARHVTVAYQPENMRFRGISIYTNTTRAARNVVLVRMRWRRYSLLSLTRQRRRSAWTASHSAALTRSTAMAFKVVGEGGHWRLRP